jgi:hypothetical protein
MGFLRQILHSKQFITLISWNTSLTRKAWLFFMIATDALLKEAQCGLQYLILSYGAKTISQERLTSLTGIERLT